MKAGIFDIDGTLVREENGVEEVVKSLRSLAAMAYHAEDFKAVVLTARSDEVRTETEEMLEENEVVYDELYMRDSSDMNKPDYLFKKQKIDELREDGVEVDFAVEDRGKVARMFEEEGITCLKMPERKKLQHSVLDWLRKFYPFAPGFVKEFYLRRYRKKFR